MIDIAHTWSASSLPRSLLAAVLACCIVSSKGAAQTLNVAPTVLVFSGRIGLSSPPPQRVAVRNSAAAPLTWQLSNRPLKPWLSASPQNGTGAGSLNVTVNTTGLRPGVYNDTISVQSNDTVRVPVVLVLTATPTAVPAGSWATYEVEFEYIGYTGLISGAPNCRVNLQGYDRLVGTLTGFEPTAGGEDVIYTGTLGRTTMIDFCETKPNPTVDERAWCTVSLDGYGVVNVELTAYGEDDRGAYLKAENAGGPLRSHVVGNCAPLETNAARDGYQLSDDLGAASPNGQPIDDVNAKNTRNQPIAISVNGVARLRVGTYPPAQPDGWTMRVIRKIP